MTGATWDFCNSTSSAGWWWWDHYILLPATEALGNGRLCLFTSKKMGRTRYCTRWRRCCWCKRIFKALDRASERTKTNVWPFTTIAGKLVKRTLNNKQTNSLCWLLLLMLFPAAGNVAPREDSMCAWRIVSPGTTIAGRVLDRNNGAGPLGIVRPLAVASPPL